VRLAAWAGNDSRSRQARRRAPSQRGPTHPTRRARGKYEPQPPGDHRQSARPSRQIRAFRFASSGNSLGVPTLHIARPPGIFGRSLRPYKIDLDGGEVGRLGACGELIVEVEPGRHRLRARIDWFVSNELVLDLVSDDECSVVVAPNGESSRDLRRNLRKSPGQWLRLTVLSEPAS
jgi:hypothetical protein